VLKVGRPVINSLAESNQKTLKQLPCMLFSSSSSSSSSCSSSSLLFHVSAS